jgi:hypothetical protein
MTGADILKTLIELLEAQEQIKITYEIEENEGGGNNGKTVPSPERGA